jgi:hypothetical protein
MRRWKGSMMRLAIATLAGILMAALGPGIASALPTVDDGFVNGRDSYVFKGATHPRVYESGVGDFWFEDNTHVLVDEAELDYSALLGQT